MKRLFTILVAILIVNIANAQFGQASLNCGIYSYIYSFAEEDNSIFAGITCGGEWRRPPIDITNIEEAIIYNKLEFYPNPPEENNTIGSNSYKELFLDNTSEFMDSINLPNFSNGTTPDYSFVSRVLYDIFTNKFKH